MFSNILLRNLIFRGQDVTAASPRLKLSDDTRHIKPEMVRALIYEAVNVSDKIQPSVLLRPFGAILVRGFLSSKHFPPLLLLTYPLCLPASPAAVISIGSLRGIPHDLSVRVEFFDRQRF